MSSHLGELNEEVGLVVDAANDAAGGLLAIPSDEAVDLPQPPAGLLGPD